MKSRKMQIMVRGHRHEWGFVFDGNPKYLAEWRKDGLCIDEIENSIPYWIAGTWFMRPWCFIQDVVCGAWLEELLSRAINGGNKGAK